MTPTRRVRLLNRFRSIFKLPVLETALAARTDGKPTEHLFCKFVPNPYQYRPGTLRTFTRRGITMKVDVSDYMGHYAFFGFLDPGLESLFSLCEDGFTVIDVGTNIGWTMLNLARKTPHGRVIGFEPDPTNHARCSANIGLNSFSNVQLFQLGLGDQPGKARIEVRTPSNRGGNRIAVSGSLEGHDTEVDIVRLDDFVSEKAIGAVNLMKIDVEGYELKVLHGAERLLRERAPVLFVEVIDANLRAQGASAAELIAFVTGLGYEHLTNAQDGTLITAGEEFTCCCFDMIARRPNRGESQ